MNEDEFSRWRVREENSGQRDQQPWNECLQFFVIIVSQISNGEYLLRV